MALRSNNGRYRWISALYRFRKTAGNIEDFPNNGAAVLQEGDKEKLEVSRERSH